MKHMLLVFIVGALAGCAAPDPYAFEKEEQGSADTGPDMMTRAVMGASAGARRDGPLTGPLTGAGISSQQYMQQQEQALKTELDDSGVTVSRDGDRIRLVMPGNITFATDSTHLQPAFIPVLDSVSRILRQFDHTLLEVTGHTDSRGSKRYNQELSELRASAVANYLHEAGIGRERLRSVGKGESVPLATNKTEAGRARNRRVELNIRSR